jgi:hypothetical protein
MTKSTRTSTSLHTATDLDQATDSPDQARDTGAAFTPFSWLNSGLENDFNAQFHALTMDVCRGVETCLQILHSDRLTQTTNEWADAGQEQTPVLEPHHGERLLLLATASMRMLGQVSEERIEAMNSGVRAAAIGGAA